MRKKVWLIMGIVTMLTATAVVASITEELKKIPRLFLGYEETLSNPKEHMTVSSHFPLVKQSEEMVTVQPDTLSLRGIIMTGDQWGRDWLVGVKKPGQPVEMKQDFNDKPRKRKSIIDIIKHDCDMVYRGYGKITDNLGLEADTPGQYTVYFCALKNSKSVFSEGVFEIEVARPLVDQQQLMTSPVVTSGGCGTVIVCAGGTVRVEVSSPSGVTCREFNSNGKLRINGIPTPSAVRVFTDGRWSSQQTVVSGGSIQFTGGGS